ncbi:hypothetical protein [Enterococcus sp. AZ103]|uniref:hypothetical protein n=1 Tax=Enterococcus sp. AZ103 TaxID=2774628 RepID=UPI003F23755F
MSNVSVLTTREKKRIMNQKRTTYLSYLVVDKYINKYDDNAVKLIHDYYTRQKTSWSQKSHDGIHVFIVEFNFKTSIVSVHSKINTNIFFTHGVFDLSRAGDYARAKFIAGLYICEYESRLDELVGKFKLSKPPSIEDYEFPL